MYEGRVYTVVPTEPGTPVLSASIDLNPIPLIPQRNSYATDEEYKTAYDA